MALQNVGKVEVFPDLAWAWNAFWRLSASRDHGMDRPSRIKVSEIECYGRLHEFLPVKTRELLLYVDCLDERWMEHVNELREEADEKRRRERGDQTPAKPKPQRKSPKS